MKKVIALMFLFLAPLFMWAQDDAEEENEGPDYYMVELSYMMPKVGQEKAFVEAVLKHNEKYHAEAPYQSTMWYIRFGEDAGWFVWGMGGMTFSDLEGAPGEGAHDEDWNKNVAPHIAKYGHNETWTYRDNWSYSDGERRSKEIIWFMDVRDGKWNQVKTFMNNVGKLYQAEERPFSGWTGGFTTEGRDMAIVIPFDEWSWMDANDWNIEDAYDEMYGDDAWEAAMEMMDANTKRGSRAIWERVE